VRGHLADLKGFLAGVCEVKSQTFSKDLKNECQDVVEWSAPSETKEETAHRVRAGDVGALATLGGLPTPTKRRIFIVCILLCVIM
jgi:hypothetical protein